MGARPGGGLLRSGAAPATGLSRSLPSRIHEAEGADSAVRARAQAGLWRFPQPVHLKPQALVEARPVDRRADFQEWHQLAEGETPARSVFPARGSVRSTRAVGSAAGEIGRAHV